MQLMPPDPSILSSPGLDQAAQPTLDLTPQPPAAAPAVPSFRQFGDNVGTRRLIFDNVLAAAQKLEPVSNPRYSLSIENARWQGPEDYSIAEQKQAVLSRGTLGRKLVGDFILRDALGNPIAKRSAQLARVPYMTDRGTFIMGGNEYTMAHQMRLRPGIFTRRKQNGELESHVNVSKGFSHRVFMDPKTGVFRIAIGQAKIPLAPVLKSMGITDRQMQEAWGNELTESNMKQSDPQAVGKLYKKLFQNGTAAAGHEQHMAVAQAFHDMTLDPEVTKRTLGKPFTNVTPGTLMEVTKKLLRVNNGEDEPDDRDAMAFQHMMGPEDLFAERLQKAKSVARQLLWKASAKGNLDSIGSGAFEDAIRSALMGSGLGMPLEEINPADIFDQQARVTRMGEGGIPSLDAVPDEARSVQPSQFGFIDFLRTPECYDRQTEVMTRRGWVRWDAVQDNDEFACLVDGRVTYNVASRLVREHYDGVMYGADTGRVAYLVTPNHRLWVSPQFRGAQYRVETAEECHGSFRRVCSGGFAEYLGNSSTEFSIPTVDRRSNNETVVASVPIGPWAELMGWWLAEGSCTYSEVSSTYNIKISQSSEANPANCDRIAATLRELPFAWSYADLAFTLATKQLAAYFRQFGHSHERFIPEYLFDAPLHARLRLYHGLLYGEGRRDRRGVRTQFCTTSEKLADDFVRLAFGLGFATCKVYEPDARPQSNHGGAWVIHIHKQNEHQLLPRSHRGRSDYYTVQFADTVFCATVPGGLLYVRRGDTVGHWSGNSGKVGVDARLARAAVKGKDGNIYTPVRDRKTGEIVYKTPQDLADAAVAFPGESQKPGAMHGAALQGGKVRMVPIDKIDYEVPDMESTFSPLGNLIPLKSMVKGQRAVMAARMITQALPLKNAEAPYVQSGVPGEDGMSFEEKYGNYMGAIRAEAPARVVSVDNDSIVLADQDGKQKTVQLYNNFPYNRKTFIHQTPAVQPGDVVKPGQLLARSNFTDDKGVTALGLNARVAYVPWGGLNFEDANLVSASFAKRASSEHMYQHQHEWEDGDHRGRNAFVSIFPSTYDRKKLENFDSDGVVKPGTIIKHGDPLILIAREKERNRKSLLKGTKSSYQDVSQTWDHESEGVVTDVVKTDKGASVVVKSMMPMQVGDKLSGRYGDKGIVSHIIPDDQMPTGPDGRPFEVLLNPLGIISRTNPAQIVEAALGKVAEMRKQGYRIPDFQNEEDMVEFALKELQKHGVSDTDTITDPVTGRAIPEVFTGNRWFMKLHHTSESKGQGRGLGSYTAEMTPAKGGAEGAKRIGMLETNALLSHGATEFIRSSHLVRGQSNPQFWAQYMSGFKPPTPSVPHVYHKFVNSLRASGINVLRDGTRTHIMALTDKDIDAMAGNRELRNVETVDWRTMEPVPGGLFDKELTGGHASSDGGGNRWSFIRLYEPLPNPAMEEPIRRVLGLTSNKFEEIMAGKERLDGATGPSAIASALRKLNVDHAIEQAREDIKSGKKTTRDAAVRRLGYLKNAKRLGIHPGEWVIAKAPVLPPAFRPVSTMGANKLPLVADPNYLYKELFEANKSLKDLRGQLDEENLGDERLGVYKALKAVTGLGDPTHPKNQERQVKGILKHVFGSSPKLGTVQRRLLGATTDLVGRAVIAPDPDLDMDQVGVPEQQAWSIYRPVLIRNLVRRGMPRLQAARAVEERSPVARKALVDEMDSGVVVINRAPTLHRYGMMAARPRLVKGNVLKISPLVVSGFGADFDGDAMQYHVPVTDEEKQEALDKMLPSRNLLSAASFKVHMLPSQEYIGGLYESSSRIDSSKPPQVFATKADAIRAYQQGRINVDRRVEILND